MEKLTHMQQSQILQHEIKLLCSKHHHHHRNKLLHGTEAPPKWPVYVDVLDHTPPQLTS